MVAGQLMLGWDWQRDAPPPLPAGSPYVNVDANPPDGYNIYYSLNGGAAALYDRLTGIDLTARAFAPPPGQGHHCFSVSAYKAAHESVKSSSFCYDTSISSNLHSLKERPSRQATFTHSGRSDNDGFTYDPLSGFHNVLGELLVGRSNYFYFVPIGTDVWRWTAYRAAVQFDLAPLDGHQLYRAVLHLYDYDNFVQYSQNARDKLLWGGVLLIQRAMTDWTQGLDPDTLPEGSTFYRLDAPRPQEREGLPVVTLIGPDSEGTTVDVTSELLQQLRSPQLPNLGFVIRGEREGWMNETETFVNGFAKVELELTYF